MVAMVEVVLDVLVWHDPETWDIGLSIPLGTALEIAGQAENHLWRTRPEQAADLAGHRRSDAGPGKGALPLW